MEQRRWRDVHGLVGATVDHTSDRWCPWCGTRLLPWRAQAGWDPGTRRRTYTCLECEGSWFAVPDPGVLVDALAAYARAASDEDLLGRAAERLRELSLAVPR